MAERYPGCARICDTLGLCALLWAGVALGLALGAVDLADQGSALRTFVLALQAAVLAFFAGRLAEFGLLLARGLFAGRHAAKAGRPLTAGEPTGVPTTTAREPEPILVPALAFPAMPTHEAVSVDEESSRMAA